MKVQLLLLVLALGIASARHRTRRNAETKRRTERSSEETDGGEKKNVDLAAEVGNLKNTLSSDDFKKFWTKLTEALGDTKEDFVKALKLNKGDMDKTLKEARTSLGDKFEGVKNAWEKAKGKLGDALKKVQKMNMNDVVKYFQNEVQNYIRDIDTTSAQGTWNAVKNRAISWWNKLTGNP